MYINNVGSISQALFARGNPDFDTVLSSQWQAAQVSLVSIANCVGRIALGFAADFGKHHWGWHRSYWMSVISIIFILSQIFMFTVEDVSSLWMASVALGFGYGGMFGLFPTIMIEGFGLGELLSSYIWSHTDPSFQKSPLLAKLGLPLPISSCCWEPLQPRVRSQSRCTCSQPHRRSPRIGPSPEGRPSVYRRSTPMPRGSIMLRRQRKAYYLGVLCFIVVECARRDTSP